MAVVLGLVLLGVEGAAAFVTLPRVGFWWLTGGTIALLAPFVLLSSRSWSRVTPEGITICWGLGHGRTYPWREIQWIDVRETQSQGSPTYAVRMFLLSGRRRSLPGLSRSDTHPAPDFDEQFQRVIDWWELSTDPAARTRPSKRFRDRLTPTVAGLVLGPLALAVVAGVAVLISLYRPH